MKKLGVVISSGFLLFLLNLTNEVLAAEPYPVKPITFIVPLEAGSDGDILLRPICQKVSVILGQPIVIVNKPGAASSIGFREVYSAKPDGYTIGLGTISLVTNKLQGLMTQDHHDFTIILGAPYRFYHHVFASTKTKRPFKTIEEVISYAKAHPRDVSVATSAVGATAWILTMALMSETGINLNVIPQAGVGALVVAQVAGGHTDIGISPLPAAKSQLEAGNLRFLAVIGPERIPGYKDIPTLGDAGFGFGKATNTLESIGFIIGPPKMPKDIIAKLAKALEAAAKDPEYQEFLLQRLVLPFLVPTDKIVPFLDVQRNVARSVLDKAGILKEK